MPYMPPGWLPCGVSTIARTYCPGRRTRLAWRRTKSVETIFSTVTIAPFFAAMAPYRFSFIGGAVVTVPAPAGAHACMSATAGTTAPPEATRPPPPEGAAPAHDLPPRPVSPPLPEPHSQPGG